MEENTMMLKQPRNDAGKLFVFANGHVEEIAADRERIFGRPSGDWIPDIAVKDSRVSRRHGQFMENYMDYMYTDTGSTNGTYLNGKLLEADKPCLLKSGDILSVSDGGVDVVKILYTKDYIKGASWREIPLNDQIAELSVGRKEVLSMNDMAVSRRHASFFNANKGWAIIDHDSLNGVYVEGRRIRQPAYLKKNDIISIAGYLFWFTGNSLICQVENIDTDGGFGRERQPQGAGPGGWNSPGGAGPGGWNIPGGGVSPGGWSGPGSLSAQGGGASPGGWNSPGGASPGGWNSPGGVGSGGWSGPGSWNGPGGGASPGGWSGHGSWAGPGGASGSVLSINIMERSVWRRFRKQTLLRDINLEVKGGEMVLILGGSGAGKTTFMNAVMGYEPARGRVVYNNVDIYNEYKKMMFEIGYVPQQELIRVNETVHHTLLNAAHMKLAAGMPPYAYEEAVDRTLSVLGLEREKQSMVSKLSGGQKKRLSIAVEYIGNPSLFFLDEPDSGLDGSMASGLMQNLRMIADEGKIVMVISHYPDRTPELFNKIIVLAKDTRDNCGHLVFFGSPNEAKQFFETDTIEAIVKRINRPDEDGEGMGDYFIEKFRNYRGY